MYKNISTYFEILHELPLLPNSTASETFLHKSGAMQSVDWIHTRDMRPTHLILYTCFSACAVKERL